MLKATTCHFFRICYEFPGASGFIWLLTYDGSDKAFPHIEFAHAVCFELN